MIPGRQFLADGVKQIQSFDASDLGKLSNLYPKMSGMRFNHVISCRTDETNSEIISNPVDRHILKIIRAQADLIVTTGKTARSENLNASSLAPMLILTRSSLLEIPATLVQSQQEVLLTTEVAPYPNSSVRTIGKTAGDLGNWLRKVTQQYDSLVLESGLATALVLQGLIDEICLTVVDANGQEQALEAAQHFLKPFTSSWRIFQLLEIEANWFMRFRPVLEN